MTIFVAFFSSTKLQLGCVMPSATITANFMQFNIKSTHDFQYPMQLFIIFIYNPCHPSLGRGDLWGRNPSFSKRTENIKLHLILVRKSNCIWYRLENQSHNFHIQTYLYIHVHIASINISDIATPPMYLVCVRMFHVIDLIMLIMRKMT